MMCIWNCTKTVFISFEEIEGLFFFSYREKDEELRQVKKEADDKARHSEMALEEFKSEVERNSNKIYEGLKTEVC